jgi:hypothetical protein
VDEDEVGVSNIPRRAAKPVGGTSSVSVSGNRGRGVVENARKVWPQRRRGNLIDMIE